ncbi:hypothetical protein MBIO_0328 [Mycoplasmopsis fermentans PG18]|uniref:Type I restriction modification DNA specificity domain-containing protein n=1 Tax=Mycoplasmopsis fermentans (strain ATCC 19989 / NBRC 14854 / NCTC 10117 / PG18) TaxID=496833 RepID=C4XEM1_MYCFP|nr:restriction endonuclease subunit S [Mycoplasmopsis fermentans]BAH69593.1 hypothetical protein MBIO_0328 [Mycoplasmopsis fermentans PG18]VEU60319.1 Type I restriction enzyme specificity protein [Mycoplasmopsis fermentans]VEU67461.1 Type I restriction enzyme specificity protein [Mesomycoplasma conjunctivae]
MSYLQKLLDKYCPDGYEWVKLEDAVEIFDNKRIPIAQNKRIKGKFPYYGANGIQDYVNDFIFDGEYILIGEDGSVIDGLNHPILNYATGKFWVNNHSHVIKAKEEFLNRFIYHFLSILDISDIVRGTPPKMTKGNLLTILIPKIPLKIQEKIVEILERFRILEAELKAELEVRGKQFDFWINKLLNFTNFDKNNSKELQSIGCFISGLRSKNKDSFVNGNQRYVSYLDVFNNKEINYLPNNFVKIFDDENQNDLNYGDVIFCGSSENFDETGYASVYTIKNDEKVYLNSFSFIFRFKDNNLFLPKFSKYFFNCKDFRDLLLKCINGVTRFNLSKEKMSKIKIPIPPIETQNKIVSILDKLSEYSQEINSGLPAEIELRSKQFKYYRDQLLDFK